MFEIRITQETIGQFILCVVCRVCRDKAVEIRTRRDVPVMSDDITSKMDLHVCSGQIGTYAHIPWKTVEI